MARVNQNNELKDTKNIVTWSIVNTKILITAALKTCCYCYLGLTIWICALQYVKAFSLIFFLHDWLLTHQTQVVWYSTVYLPFSRSSKSSCTFRGKSSSCVKQETRSFTAMATYHKLCAVMHAHPHKTRSVKSAPQTGSPVESTEADWKKLWITWQSFIKMLAGEGECGPWEITCTTWSHAEGKVGAPVKPY